ncbi:MAG: tRNA (adenosine(37)-N6)-dimethylallyltransferase MiaA [Candidatus Dojkabacteria bacterium]
MNPDLSRPIIVLAGPTCSGKSRLGTRLAKELNGVIINGDSRQIYKELSIGTARPSQNDMEGIPHYLYGYVSVKDSYSIFEYQKDVASILKKIPKEKIPIIVGGTGLYIDSVVFNYKLTKDNRTEKDTNTDLNVEELQEKIPRDILNRLNESDIKNPVRLLRIIEKGDLSKDKGKPLNHIYIVVDIPKKELRERIENRVCQMILNGLVEENKDIRGKGLNKYLPLKSIGYQEFDGFFGGEKSIDQVKEEIINHTNQYAKRQRTWFRRNKKTIWTNDYDLILESSLRFIKTL